MFILFFKSYSVVLFEKIQYHGSADDFHWLGTLCAVTRREWLERIVLFACWKTSLPKLG